MDKITINKLTLDGIHGLTEKERNLPQKFQIDICMTGSSKAHVDDSIDTALDYRVARGIATEIVQNQSFFLLETMVHRIADEILKNTTACSVMVTVQKLEIWSNGIPGVTVSKDKTPSHLDFLNFDMGEALECLAIQGGTSIPILHEKRRADLLKEAYFYQYQSQPEVVGGGKVREQLSSVKEFSEISLFQKLRNDFTELLIRKSFSLKVKDIFSTPIDFNDLSLQKYARGSIGVTPHKDGKSRINLICIFILTGKAEFGLCEDRNASNPIFLDTTPGNVIILRAPGFFHSTFQPFHFVRNVTEERIVFGLRQKLSK